jgi:hypothetical protein
MRKIGASLLFKWTKMLEAVYANSAYADNGHFRATIRKNMLDAAFQRKSAPRG